jgi:histidinol-phosphate aminotransferase
VTHAEPGFGPEQLLRADLRGLDPYGAPQLDVPVRLNVNENPYPPDDELVDDLTVAVAHSARTLNRYPDRDAVELRSELADFLHQREWVQLSADQIWVANGSNELMLQVLQAFGGPGRLVLSFAPTYSMYPEYCRDTFTEYLAVDRLPDFSIDPTAAVHAIGEHRPDVVLLASPNNPSGTALDAETLAAILAAAPGLVVVDEAYAEFRRPGTATALSLLADHPRLVVTRTMSKAFALAGARVGYLAADPEIVRALQLVRLPYHLSAVTQAVARTALAHADSLLAQVDALRAARDELVEWLHDTGLEVAASDANFVLFGRFPNRHEVWEQLLSRGVLIRETGPDGWLRVSIGTPEEMRAFQRALEEVIA